MSHHHHHRGGPPHVATQRTVGSSSAGGAPSPHLSATHAPASPLPMSSPSGNASSGGSGQGISSNGTANAAALLPSGSAAFLDLIDRRALAILRDGRNLIGILRSYDQFGNLVFQDTVERIYAGNCFGDIDRGVFLIRGENLVMLGEVDGDAEDALPIREAPIDEVLALQRMELDARLAREAAELRTLATLGFSVDLDPNDTY
ncbi:hypothetical protein H9P43_003586 [Blastocladiella emersonii ATCC 22665]|nr:hypothetical protein H9P43_003586 [Blastocladiella emersonii ATCC 22665]